MTWRRWLQSRTRNPRFLWRMVIGILLAGSRRRRGRSIGRRRVDRRRRRRDDLEASSRARADPRRPDWERLERLADAGEWLALWRAIPGVDRRDAGDSWASTTLAVLTGACWLAFSLQAIQPRGRGDGRLWLPVRRRWRWAC